MGAGSAALPLAEPEGAVLRAPSSPRNPPPPWYSSAVFEFRPPLCAPSALPRLPTGTASSHSVSSVCPHILPCVTSPRPLPTHPPTSPLHAPLSVPTSLPVPTAPSPCPLTLPHVPFLHPLPTAPTTCPLCPPPSYPPHIPGPPPRPLLSLCVFSRKGPPRPFGDRGMLSPEPPPAPFVRVVPKQQQCSLWWVGATPSHHGRGSVIRVDNDL